MRRQGPAKAVCAVNTWLTGKGGGRNSLKRRNSQAIDVVGMRVFREKPENSLHVQQRVGNENAIKPRAKVHKTKEQRMADQRMSDADYAAYKPYAEEIIALVNQHIARRPNPLVLDAAWRVGYVTVLSEIVRGYHLVPDQIESYLNRVCAEVIAETQASVRHWDIDGPKRS